MDIEIALPAKCAFSGSAFLKTLQDNSIPLLDLLTREAIQNSLDASTNEKDFVKVDFLQGEFDKTLLNSHFTLIDKELNRRFKESTYEYLAIRDYNTYGLTGPVEYEGIKNNDYGNFFKLVYEISKPQEKAGSGGSWGYGKTVYFRIGIGLVIFYSRIYENGKYQSRLAATYVEDETQKNCILPEYQNQVRRGIAWWGEQTSENKTKPLLKEEEINKILSIFNIIPYKDSETGTTIIIPYINSKELLIHNIVNSDTTLPEWYSSIAEYLRLSIQRWYAPRLNNSDFTKHNKISYLKAFVNSQAVEGDQIQPVFRYIKEMYNYAFKDQKKSIIFDEEKIKEIYCKTIKLNGGFSSQNAGTFVFIKLNKEQLKMVPPINKKSPFLHINIEGTNKYGNKPVICYTRKPGMIVNYETSETKGGWIDHNIQLSDEEFVFGIFVLNSTNEIFNLHKDFEEYVRKSEMAVHNSWEDYPVKINGKNDKLTIITRIKSKVRNELSEIYGPSKNTIEFKQINGEFSDFFGKMLLPETGFGDKPSLPVKKTPDKNKLLRNKPVTFKILFEKTLYEKDYITFVMEASISKKVNEINIPINIASETAADGIPLMEWEDELLLNKPFEFEEIKVCCLSTKERVLVSKQNQSVYKDTFTTSLLFTAKGTGSKIVIESKTDEKMNFEISAKVKIYDKRYKPVLCFTKKEKENYEE